MDWMLGIDIAKATFAVSLLRPNGKRRHKQFPNTAAGHAALVDWLAQHASTPVHACLEATGTYGEAVATVLVDAGHQVSLVNPAATHAFAQSQLRRSKTDGVDADVVADFCRAHRPPLWTPWPVEVRVLQGLVRRREAVQDMLIQERNRQQAGALVPPVAVSVDRHISQLEAELAALEAQIRAHLDQHPTLRAQRDLLLTIPGIGPATAAWLLAECRAITDFPSARAYAAYAGLVPRIAQSGRWPGRAQLSKLGNARLRHALYFPAITALRSLAAFQGFRTRMRAAGKHPRVIIAAVMRKLLHIAYGVLKHQRAFDPTMLSA